jgi:hypothetical protein
MEKRNFLLYYKAGQKETLITSNRCRLSHIVTIIASQSYRLKHRRQVFLLLIKT